NVQAKDINLAAGSNLKMKAGGKLMLEGKTVDIKGTGAVKVGAGDKLSLKGKTTAVQGKKVSLAGKVTNKVKTKHGIGKIKPTGSAASPASTGLKLPSSSSSSTPVASVLSSGVTSGVVPATSALSSAAGVTSSID